MGVSGVTATKNERKGEKESIIVSPSPKKAMPLRLRSIAAVWLYGRGGRPGRGPSSPI